jgi:hypothetical protein
VGIKSDAMRMLMLGTLVEGSEFNDDIPHIDKLDVLSMDGVEPKALIDGKEEITKVPSVKFGDELEGSTILDETLMLDNM